MNIGYFSSVPDIACPVWTWSDSGTSATIRVRNDPPGTEGTFSSNPDWRTVPPKFSNAEFKFNGYTAKCLMTDVEDRALHYAKHADDTVTVNGYSYPRTRYRACCNPAFFVLDDTTYVIVNTGLGKLDVYNVETGTQVKRIDDDDIDDGTCRVPEIMTAIFGYKDDPLKFHLFGWGWGPYTVDCSLDMRDIMKL
jgi:hypothetical protein